MTDDQFRELASGNMSEAERKAAAAHFTGALSREMAKPEPLPPLSLYHIESDLQELLECREEAEAGGSLPEELSVIDERIRQYALAEVKKVDGIAMAMRSCMAFAEECEKEAARLTTMAKRHRSRLERIKASALWAMSALGITKLSTPKSALRVQGNGGVEPLEVYDATVLPESCRQYTVTMSGMAYRFIKDLCAGAPQAIGVLEEAKAAPCTALIRAALRDSEVPGVRLLPRGSHLRVD